jgi:methylated-DNA-[protein]-cysteine S-methyltransferase
MSHSWTIYESPVGPLTLVRGPDGLRALYFPGQSGPLDERCRDDGRFNDVSRQLDEYFTGTRQRFDLPLDLRATLFQRGVWAQLSAIPYGATRSYSELARAIGRTDRIRAVAASVARTPVPIIVPCHRAVAADGALTGYLGGLHRKRSLLDFEAAISNADPVPAVWAHRQLSLT